MQTTLTGNLGLSPAKGKTKALQRRQAQSLWRCADVEGLFAQALGQEGKNADSEATEEMPYAHTAGLLLSAALCSVRPSQVTWGPLKLPLFLLPILGT